MCGGICGSRDRYRHLFADRHLSTGNIGDIMRGVIDFHCGKATAESNRAEMEPALTLIFLIRAGNRLRQALLIRLSRLETASYFIPIMWRKLLTLRPEKRAACSLIPRI
jgi:hypothetical protein